MKSVEKVSQKVGRSNQNPYKENKKIKNRLSWIKRRIQKIEGMIDIARAIIHDKNNIDNFQLLQEKIEKIEGLEIEYLSLLEEDEQLKNKIYNNQNK